MDFNFRPVDISDIDLADRTFQISTPTRVDAVASSIERIGLVNPPVLAICDQSFVVVTGFARIEACRKLGMDPIPARCLLPDVSFSECALYAIADNCSLREMNIVEQANAVQLLVTAFNERHERMSAAEAIGLGISASLEEKLLAVREMGYQLQRGLIEGTIGLPIALKLHLLYDADSAASLADLIRDLHISLTRQRELIDWIETITNRDGLTVQDLLSDHQIKLWRTDGLLDGPQKSRLIRDHLKKRSQPAIAAFEQRYAQAVKAIGLDKGITFVPPPNFEGRTFSLHMAFTDREELLQKTEEIRKLIQCPAFGELLDPDYESD